MTKETVVLDYVLDITPDIDRNGKSRHSVAIDVMTTENNIRKHFLDKDTVSLRGLFNNLDGDARSGRSYLENEIAGTVVSIAAYHAVSRIIDDDESLMESESYEDLSEFIDIEFNNTISAAIDPMCSYLFGKHVLTESFQRSNSDDYEEMYEVCENLLWTLITTLVDEIDDIDNLCHLMISDEYIYPVAIWEEEYLLVSFKSSRERLSPVAVFDILNRGVINEQRYHHPYRSRSRH